MTRRDDSNKSDDILHHISLQGMNKHLMCIIILSFFLSNVNGEHFRKTVVSIYIYKSTVKRKSPSIA